MNRKFYKYGLRLVYSEERKPGIPRYYALDWITGEFNEDMSYLWKISNDISGDAIELDKETFEQYVNEVKKRKGLT